MHRSFVTVTVSLLVFLLLIPTLTIAAHAAGVAVKTVKYSLATGTKSIPIGYTTKGTASVQPSNATNKTLTFKSSNERVATVSKTGAVTGKGKGTATITATAKNGKKASVTVKVHVVPVTKVAVSGAKTIMKGKTTQITPIIVPKNASYQNIKYVSSDPAVASVNSKGVVTGKKAGVAHITITETKSGKKSGNSVPIVVKDAKSGLAYISVDAVRLTGPKTLIVGKTGQLSVVVQPFDANQKVEYISSNTGIATVNSKGLVSAKKAGAVTITAYSKDGKSSSLTIYVETKKTGTAVTGVALYPTSGATIAVNDILTLGAVVSPSTASNQKLTFVSKTPAVATVDQLGQVKGIAAGTTTITATASNKKSASVVVTVTEPVPVPEDEAAAAPGAKKYTGKAYAENPNNPLVTSAWAVNYGWWDNKNTRTTATTVSGAKVAKRIGGPLDDYMNFTTTGAEHKLLERIVSQPASIYFTPSNSSKENGAQNSAKAYIEKMQQGDKNALVQMTIFGIFNVGGGEYSTDALTAAEKAKYKAWIQYLSEGIADAKVALIFEADAALLAARVDTPGVAREFADTATRRSLIKWAAKYISEHNKNAAIYLDAGDADWLDADDAVRLLKQIGIEYARGFALGATHLAATRDGIYYAQVLSKKLAIDGYANKKAILDTADNGNGFTHGDYTGGTDARVDTKGLPYGDPRTQTYAGQARTSVLGIAPTWQVASADTGLSSELTKIAKQYVDGYLWFGRPWLYQQTSPYSRTKALAAARYTTDKTLLKIK
ncbi:MAG: Ig-like domain-containing protein [Oscillospiraceae bacterium]|jgi:uncharacterized protein YjdB|nr:Ig-like domain-containing protein [Oscillospiraceae bacterium]